MTEPKDDEKVAKLRDTIESAITSIVDELSTARNRIAELEAGALEHGKEMNTLQERLTDAEEERNEFEEKADKAEEQLLIELAPIFELAHAQDPTKYEYLWRTLGLDESIMARYARLVG